MPYSPQRTQDIFLGDQRYGRNVVALKMAVDAWTESSDPDAFLRFVLREKESQRILKTKDALKIVLKTREHNVKKILLASQLQTNFGNDLKAYKSAVDIWAKERTPILEVLYLVLETRREEAEMYVEMRFREAIEFGIIHQHRKSGQPESHLG